MVSVSGISLVSIIPTRPAWNCTETVRAVYFRTKNKLISEPLHDRGRRSNRSSLCRILRPRQRVRQLLQSISDATDAQQTELIDRTHEGRWNRGYQRCLRHLRRLDYLCYQSPRNELASGPKNLLCRAVVSTIDQDQFTPCRLC